MHLYIFYVHTYIHTYIHTLVFSNYFIIFMCAIGSGLTPCASILAALTKYKWKKNFNPEILHLYWVVRQSEVESFQVRSTAASKVLVPNDSNVSNSGWSTC